MKKKFSAQDFVTAHKVCDLLEIDINTVYAWLRVGRLKAVKGKKPYQIYKSSLNVAKRGKCKQCKKPFDCLRPQKRVFCSEECYNQWYYENKTKKRSKTGRKS